MSVVEETVDENKWNSYLRQKDELIKNSHTVVTHKVSWTVRKDIKETDLPFYREKRAQA